MEKGERDPYTHELHDIHNQAQSVAPSRLEAALLVSDNPGVFVVTFVLVCFPVALIRWRLFASLAIIANGHCSCSLRSFTLFSNYERRVSLYLQPHIALFPRACTTITCE